jgi:hypothetical protein
MNRNILQEIKAMNKIAGTQLTKEQEIKIIKERLEQLNEAVVKVGSKVGNQMVIATDKENEMDINSRVKSAIEKKGAKIDDFAILVPVSRYGEYDYDMSAGQFLADINKLVIKKRSQL